MIKFRHWCNIENKMYEDAYVEEHRDFCFMSELIGKAQERYTFMQYTGLKDKNGKEIYEGDIVTWRVNGITRTAPVYYDEDQACCWMGKDISGNGGLVLNDWMRGEYEIIGNIYDNPELLERGEKG